MKNIIENALSNAFTYQEYRALHEGLVAANKTSGSNQTESLIAFTKLNNSRSKRWDKRYTPSVNFSNFNPEEKETWLVIAETWCGDAAQNIPVISKIADQMANVDLRIVLRDENLELMDSFLTNGGRSIPKLIRLNKNTLEVLGTWGARPKAAAPLLAEYKSNPEITHDMFSENMARWYVADNGKSIEEDFIEILSVEAMA